MASASQLDQTFQEDELEKLLSTLKASRQTQALRARLPDQLIPFASKITISKPVQDTLVSEDDGLYDCAFSINKRRIEMSVAVGSEDPPKQKALVLVWREWSTNARYLTGSAGSSMVSLDLKYMDRKKLKNEMDPTYVRHCAHAFVGEYGDPGRSMYQSHDGGIKKRVRELVKDMGFDGEINEVWVLEALLGDDGAELLARDRGMDEQPVLAEIIEKEIDYQRCQ